MLATQLPLYFLRTTAHFFERLLFFKGDLQIERAKNKS